MQRGVILFLSVAIMVWMADLSLAEINKGANDIVIPGGTQGNVKFPHDLHQEGLKDCMLCHDLFPQQAGSISDLKQKGTLAQKQVMNQQCIKCHRAKKTAGEKSGPVSCSQCHAK